MSLFKPDATMLTGLIVGIFIIPWALARLNK